MSGVVPVPGPVPSSSRWPALIPPVLIAIPFVLKLVGIPVNNAWIIFALLFGLMLTGMPISISLGLTVLTYLFTMTTVPIESVALKLFTGIERFEIMAIPFFILAGNFLTHGGVARRMIDFAAAMVSHWHGGLGLAGGRAGGGGVPGGRGLRSAAAARRPGCRTRPHRADGQPGRGLGDGAGQPSYPARRAGAVRNVAGLPRPGSQRYVQQLWPVIPP